MEKETDICFEEKSESKEQLSTKTLFPKAIIVINTSNEWEKAYQLFSKNFTLPQVIGFDCEWTRYNAISLVQLTNLNRLCLLVRVVNVVEENGKLPKSFADLLQNINVIKAGVAITCDSKRLQEAHGVVVRGCVDLRLLLMKVDVSNKIKPLGLKHLCKELLGVELEKDTWVRCGDWDAEELNDKQMHYAAMDSLVSLEIFKELIRIRKRAKESNARFCLNNLRLFLGLGSSVDKHGCDSKDEQCEEESKGDDVDGAPIMNMVSPSPKQNLSKGLTQKNEVVCDDRDEEPYNENTSGDDAIAWNIVMPLCRDIIDVQFKQKLANQRAAETMETFEGIASTSSTKQTSGLPSSKASYNRALQGRKTPLYDNCMLLDINGSPLATCDSRKAKWYMQKGLAEQVGNDPLRVRLLFSTAGRPMDDDGYYLQKKDNVCVVCGVPESYLRKNIIPREYRKHFPAIFKDHKSHDVILLCTACHQCSNHHDTLVKQSLALTYHAPFRSDKFDQCLLYPRAKSAAKALKGGHKIPEERRRELLGVLREYHKEETGVEEFNEVKLIDFANNYDHCKKLNPSYEEHGRLVVAAVSSDKQGLIEFEKMWRQHFLDTMQPRHLPKLWSVDHCHD